jgi:cytochrome c556
MIKGTVSMSALVVAGFIGTISAHAADAIADRQAVMKNNGAATRVLAGMVKGETPFDAVAAQLALRTMNSTAIGVGYMFPEGSQTGAKNRAAATIWTDRAGFDAEVNKFAKSTSAKVTDLEGLKTAFGVAASSCGSCHKAYRTK